MMRYSIQPTDKAAISRNEYFVEFGLLDFWSISMRNIGTKNIPPAIRIDDIEKAYSLMKLYIAECGNTLILDLPDGYNADYVSGIEIENGTMRLIWYSADKAYQSNDTDELNDASIKMNQHIFGENLEQQYGFSFDYMILTPAYILIYAKKREVPEEIDSDKEILKKQPPYSLTIYEHNWGSFEHEPILQYNTRYYCDAGLIAVLSPKACRNSFRPDSFFEN